MHTPILVSACLCGVPCRYDGTAAPHPVLLEWHAKGLVIPVCPEALGGLATPRPPCEILDGRVVDATGRDLTAFFTRGARETLRIAEEHGALTAVLKERSPSCGSRVIYDGTFSGRKVAGQGVTTALLRVNGIIIFSEEDLPPLPPG